MHRADVTQPNPSERRKALRTALECTCRVGNLGPGRICDISETGLRVELATPLAAGRLLALGIEATEEVGPMLSSVTRVAWCTENGSGYTAGLQFVRDRASEAEFVNAVYLIAGRLNAVRPGKVTSPEPERLVLLDLLQTLAVLNKSAEVLVDFPGSVGRLRIQAGVLVHASLARFEGDQAKGEEAPREEATGEEATGEDALCRMISQPGQKFTLSPLEPEGRRTLALPLGELLLRCAVALDEENRPEEESG